jgi:FkbH-like protein
MKKCIVLDLDNTLWGGIVGEDGIDGIALSLSAPGNSFIAFQQALLDYYNKGIILAINSRNNPEDAWNVIRNHPNMILKEQHFVAARINWNDKAANIRELATELNIGLDSMVFLDDDKTNREMVKSLVPEVFVPDLPESPKEYTKFLNSLTCFSLDVITDEDKMRGNLYVTERLRKEQEKAFISQEEFLASLSLEMSIYKNDTSCIPRLAQLTEKTNQFNTCKRPLSEEEVLAYISDETYVTYHASLTDTFGSHGVILYARIKKTEKVWIIESLLMSCRVFGRGVEDAFLSVLIRDAQKEGVETICIVIESTEKNIPAREFAEKQFINNERSVETPFTSPAWIILHTYENF